MTIVKAYTAVDFLDGRVGFYGEVTVATCSLIKLADSYGNSNDYYGSFSYDGNGSLVGGTVTGIQAFSSNVLALEVSGADVPALDVASAVLNSDFLTLYSYFLSGNDVISGSSMVDRISGQGGSDEIHAGGGSDTVFGGTGADKLYGNTGNDALFGNKGKDTLLGGAKGDQLYGGGGNDILKGNKGNDMLMGGGGRDTFYFRKGDGRDTITDFNTGKDTIEIGGGATRIGQLDFKQTGDDVAVTFKNVEIFVENITLSELNNSDNFLF
ncbi:hypothetical protein GI582_24940 [Sulfitobacter sp. BDSS02]|nr:hypothetical protein [Sulfitobacter sp. BDSS02]MBR9852659.1 calcium-binding protein [Paracoccaceae bacterium]